ncbi:unnamed protein product [Ilex paraguariensis]|uniref:Myb-related protein 123 n=1 Tax=Ilex paraguariensis TaxID=185542 RepID=A0ABC8R7M9_9AQUA
MGRSPCCSKVGLNRGAWTAAEDKILTDYINHHGEGKWRNLPKIAGLKRCGKSCRLRWLNYLRPDIKRGNISHDEEELIIRLHKLLGNRWSLIAGRLPGRTDNEIKNYWNTNLGKRVDHQPKPISTRRPSKKKASTGTPKSETQDKNASNLGRTKAVRCSKLLTSSQHPRAESIDSSTEPAQSVVHNSSDVPNPTGEEDKPTEFMPEIEMGEESLWDLLNSDFSDLGEFNHSNSNGVSPSSGGAIMSPKELLEDWTIRECLQPFVASSFHHYFSSVLESEEDWLAK